MNLEFTAAFWSASWLVVTGRKQWSSVVPVIAGDWT